MDEFICFIQGRLAIQFTVQLNFVDLGVNGKKGECDLIYTLYDGLDFLEMREFAKVNF